MLKTKIENLIPFYFCLFSCNPYTQKHQRFAIGMWKLKIWNKLKNNGWSRSFSLVGGLQDLGISVDGAVMVEVGGIEFLCILKIYIYKKFNNIWKM